MRWMGMSVFTQDAHSSDPFKAVIRVCSLWIFLHYKQTHQPRFMSTLTPPSPPQPTDIGSNRLIMRMLSVTRNIWLMRHNLWKQRCQRQQMSVEAALQAGLVKTLSYPGPDLSAFWEQTLSVHLLSSSASLSLRAVSVAGACPAAMGWRQGYTTDKPPVHRKGGIKTNSHSHQR